MGARQPAYIRLKAFRKRLDLSVHAACAQVGAHHPNWLRWEKGEEVPECAYQRALHRWSAGELDEHDWPPSKAEVRIEAARRRALKRRGGAR